MIGDVHELLVLPPQVQLVALGHPFRLRFAKDLDQSSLGQLGRQLWLEGDEGIDRVGVGVQSCQDGRVDNMAGVRISIRRRDRVFGGGRRENDLAALARRAHCMLGEAQ